MAITWKEIGSKKPFNVGMANFNIPISPTLSTHRATLDISSVYEDYKKLTDADFVPLVGTIITMRNSDGSVSGTITAQSYESDTGIFTVDCRASNDIASLTMAIPVHIIV